MALLMPRASISGVSILNRSSLFFSLFLTVEAAAVPDYKPETVLMNKERRQKQIGLEYEEQKKTVGIIPVTASSGLRSCESAPCHP